MSRYPRFIVIFSCFLSRGGAVFLSGGLHDSLGDGLSGGEGVADGDAVAVGAGEVNAGVVGFDVVELLVDGGDVEGVLGNGVGPAVEGGVAR